MSGLADVNRIIRLVICISFCISPQLLSATPTGLQLLEACEIAVSNGFKGSEGLVCEWYVTPCDCNIGKPEVVPRVCLPEVFASKELAQKVISALKSEPELSARNADVAAAIILSRSYPCAD